MRRTLEVPPPGAEGPTSPATAPVTAPAIERGTERATPRASKRATNLSLNAKVLDMARELGMNLSATVDGLLAAEVQRRYWERWNADNKEAIEHYNARIAREGLPLARYRTFMKNR